MSGARDLRKQQAASLPKEDVPGLFAQDVMIRPCFLYPEDSAATILKRLRKEDVNACIVVTKDKRFLGEISDNDIIRLFQRQVREEPLVQVLNHGYRREFAYKTAKDMVNNHTAAVKRMTPVNDVIELIFKEGFEYIPVLDDKKKVLGVVTPSSLINRLKDY